MAGKSPKGRGGKQTGGNKGPAANPGAKGKAAGGAPVPPVDPMSGLSGGGTRGKVPPPSGPNAGQGDKAKDTVVTWAPGEDPWWVVSVLELTSPDWLGNDEDDDEGRYARWLEWAEHLDDPDKGTTHVLIFKHLCDPDTKAEVEIHRALCKVITAARLPRITADTCYVGGVDEWKGRGLDPEKLLMDARGIHHRYHGADSVLLAAPLAVWPPPLELAYPGLGSAEGASVCWEVRFNRTPKKEELRAWATASLMEEGREWKGTTWFRKADAKGRPTTTWFLKALFVREADRVNFEFTEGEGDDLLKGICTWAPQCAFCLERPGGIGTHAHSQCPLLGTINKIRQQGELKPLWYSLGVLVREDEKVDLDLTKEMRAMKTAFALLQDRVFKLETTGGKGPASNEAGPSGKGKKRKQEEAGAPQRGGPAKRGRGGGQGGQGRPPAGGQGGGPSGQGGKGKGKAPAGGPGAANTWN